MRFFALVQTASTIWSMSEKPAKPVLGYQTTNELLAGVEIAEARYMLRFFGLPLIGIRQTIAGKSKKSCETNIARRVIGSKLLSEVASYFLEIARYYTLPINH